MNYSGEVVMSAQEFADIVMKIRELEEKAASMETYRTAWESARQKAARLEKELEEKEDNF